MDNSTIIAFIRKEPMSNNVSNTDGNKLFYGDTCVGQWKDHRVIITDSFYNEKDLDSFIGLLQKWAKKSDLIFQLCSKVVKRNAKNLLSYI